MKEVQRVDGVEWAYKSTAGATQIHVLITAVSATPHHNVPTSRDQMLFLQQTNSYTKIYQG